MAKEDTMRHDVEVAYDKNDPNKLGMTYCPHCGKKLAGSMTGPGSVGGDGAAAATGGSGGGGGGG